MGELLGAISIKVAAKKYVCKAHGLTTASTARSPVPQFPSIVVNASDSKSSSPGHSMHPRISLSMARPFARRPLTRHWYQYLLTNANCTCNNQLYHQRTEGDAACVAIPRIGPKRCARHVNNLGTLGHSHEVAMERRNRLLNKEHR